MQEGTSWWRILLFLIINIAIVIKIEGKSLVTKIKELMKKIKNLKIDLKGKKLRTLLQEYVHKLPSFIVWVLTNPIIMCIIIVSICIWYANYINDTWHDLELGRKVGLSLFLILLILYFAFYIIWRIIDKAQETFANVGSVWHLLFFSTLLDICVAYETVSGFRNNSSLIISGVCCLEILSIIYIFYKITRTTITMIIQVGAAEAARETGTAVETREEYSVGTKLYFVFFLNIMHILLFALFMFYLHSTSIILSVNGMTPHFYEFGDTSANTTTYTQTDIQHELDNTELFRFLNNSYYYVTTTYTSVGYGDIVPITAPARAFSMFISLDGFFMSAVIIGLILDSIKKKTDKNTG